MHVADTLQMWKHLTEEDKKNYVYISEEDDDSWGEPTEQDLDSNKNYVGLRVVKNRYGSKNDLVCFEVQMNENIWKEIGILKKRER
jgi:hypothetical protein